MDFLNNITLSEVQVTIIRILAIFLILLAIVFLVRLTFNLTIFFLLKKYRGYKERKKSKQDDVVKFNKEDEELLRDKEEELEAQRELVGVERLPKKREQEDELGLESEELEEGKIVGIAEPIGFWTSLILGQKLTFLVNRAYSLNQKKHKGFWVSLVEAQSMSRERQRGRGR